MDNKPDNDLMNLVAEKNTQALKVLYHRYEIQVYNFIYRYTGNRGIAQELIQETFTRVWFASHMFNERRGSFKGWLYTIALNITRNEMSKKEYTYHYLDAHTTLDYERGGDSPKNENPEKVFAEEELQNSIANALGKLQPYLREVIILKNYHHLKFKEIAEVTNAPEGTVKARYHKAIELLKTFLNSFEVNDHV
jgi:RNA polymerase sigma factor (sigma-70 family)